MKLARCFPWSAGLLAGVLLAASSAAMAGGSVGVQLNFGFPGHGAGWHSGWPGATVGLQVGGGRHWHRGHRGWRHGWAPGAVLLVPPLVYGVYHGAPLYGAQAVTEPPGVSVGPTLPEPAIYPRNGQDAQQTEYDRQQCNRWAVTQPEAVADAGFFQRAVQACLDGRGYTLR